MEHGFDIEIAQKHGVNAAILYKHFQLWIVRNKANGYNLQDGRTWSYDPLRAIADQHPYLGVWEVRNAIQTLVNAGVLRKANYNTKGYDRTTWYAFEDEKAALQGLPSHLWKSQTEDAKSTNGLCKNHTTIPTPTPVNIPSKNNKDVGNFSLKESELVLEKDQAIAQGLKRFFEGLYRILRAPRGQREERTFTRMGTHFVDGCQSGRYEDTIFDKLVSWMNEARTDGKNPKALFVSMVKERTEYKAQKKLLAAKDKRKASARQHQLDTSLTMTNQAQK